MLRLDNSSGFLLCYLFSFVALSKDLIEYCYFDLCLLKIIKKQTNKKNGLTSYFGNLDSFLIRCKLYVTLYLKLF